MPILWAMPLYEYKCSDCEKVHEVIQKFADAPLEICPTCQGPLTKLISMSSFSLKGSGWYTTDYKKSSAPVGDAATDKSAAEATSDGKVNGNDKESKDSKADNTNKKTESTAPVGSSSTSPSAEKKSGIAETKSVEKKSTTSTAPATKAAPAP
jgi:putative FmdB family regulatory protein